MSDPSISSQLSIQTIRSDGTAPKRRLATPEAALLAYQEMRQIEARRDLRFSALAGIFNGLPPTSPEEMEENGIGDMPNINTKQFEAKIRAYVDNWTSINAAGDEWAEVEMEHEDPMEQLRRSKLVTEFFNNSVKKWDGDDQDFVVGRHYVVKSAARDTQMGIYGIGVAHWPDHIDFRWNMRPTRKVLVPEGTNLLLDNCPFLAIEDEISVPDLWAMRDKPGWNKDAITALLYMNTCRSNIQMSQYFTFAEWQERARENDTWMYSDFPLVRIVHVYVKEFSSAANRANITHCVISDAYPVLSGTPSGNNGEQVKRDFEKAKKDVMSWLYEKEKVATRWSQVVSVFSDNSGPEGKWHGVKGFGDMIFDGCHFNNLMFNRTAVAAIIANLPMFQGGNEEAAQKMKQLKICFGGILNPGLELQQVKISTDINAAMSMFNLGTSIVNTNSRQFPMGDQKLGGEAPTATQINFERADEARFTNLQVMFYRCTGLDPLFSEMYRRIAQPAKNYPESWPGGNIAKAFRDKCREAGIPEADLLKVRSVRANRNVGTGNMGLDIMQADQLLSVATPGQGQLNARYKKACALVGPEAARAFVEMEQPAPNFQDTVIDLENLGIQNGQTPQAYGYQPHEKHLGVGLPNGHITILAQAEQIAAQMLEAGLETNLEAASRIHRVLQSGVEHSAQHVQFLASVPRVNGRKGLNEEVVRDLNKMLNDFAQFTEAFGQSLEEAQQKANPQAGVSPEMLEAQNKMQIDTMKAENDMQIRRAQAAAKMENDAIKTQVRGQMQMGDHEYKMGLKAQEDVQALQAQQAKTAQELRAKTLSASIDIGAQTIRAEQDIQKKQAEAETTTTEE
jgi:hypothetical protein